MESKIRRVVTTHDVTGRAVVLLDGPASNIKHETAGPVATLLWVTDSTPPDIASDVDAADRVIGVPPPPGGTIFRVVEFPPAGENDAQISREEVLKEMGIAPDAGTEGKSRHRDMHRTNSIDYAVVMSGEIDMLLDDSDVHLKAGDVVVQRATNHAWVNNGDAPCKIAFILIDAGDKAE